MDLLNLGGDLHQKGDDLHQHTDYSLMNNHNINQFMIDTIFEITDLIQPPLTGMQLSSVFQHYFTLDDTIQLMSQSGVISTADLPVTDNSNDDVESPYVPALNQGLSRDADITNFLSRPVRIFTIPWAGADITQSFQPWNLFFNTSAVQKKMDNFFLVKGNLELTFYVDGTPFHSGCILASYRYGPTDHGGLSGNRAMITRSQRQHLFLNPATNKGGCICVPFLYPTPWIKTNVPSPTAGNIGTINLDTLVQLRQQGAVSDAVRISVFARLIDFELTAPTSDLVSMSGTADEFNDSGPVSKVANSIADAAGMLSAIPSIAPFALATSMASRTVANIARLFGYSRPTVIDNTSRVQNSPVSSLALMDSCDTSKKLSATSKQELSIDPRIVGLPPDDQLSIKSFAQRETVFTKFDWNTTDVVDTVIYGIAVDPMIEGLVDNSIGAPVPNFRITPTSLSFISRNFNFWSGTLKFRFQVFCSQYQRGKIAIVYEPSTVFNPSASWYTTNHYIILDLSATKDATIEIPWQQAEAFAQIIPIPNNPPLFRNGVQPGSPESNGTLHAVVVNDLVSPDGVSSASIIVSISAGDDFVLMDPSSDNARVSPYDPLEAQSGTPVFVTSDSQNSPESMNSSTKLINTSPGSDDKTLMYFGERLVSVRQLLKRFTNYTSARAATVSEYTESSHSLWAYPISNGFSPVGVHLTAAGDKYNYTYYGPLTYFRNAFYGWKGSIRYKVMPKFGNIDSMQVVRIQSILDLNNETPFDRVDSVYPPNAGPSVTAAFGRFGKVNSPGGICITPNSTMDALEFEIPYAFPTRFSTTAVEADNVVFNAAADAYPSGNKFRLLTSTKELVNATFDLFVAAGEDFSFYGFNGAPEVFYYEAQPTPA